MRTVICTVAMANQCYKVIDLALVISSFYGVQHAKDMSLLLLRNSLVLILYKCTVPPALPQHVNSNMKLKRSELLHDILQHLQSNVLLKTSFKSMPKFVILHTHSHSFLPSITFQIQKQSHTRYSLCNKDDFQLILNEPESNINYSTTKFEFRRLTENERVRPDEEIHTYQELNHLKEVAALKRGLLNTQPTVLLNAQHIIQAPTRGVIASKYRKGNNITPHSIRQR